MGEINPYQPPTTASAPSGPAEVRLYSPNAIGAHAFFFTPLVGGIMAAVNLARLGEHASARRCALAWGASTLALVGISALLPDSFDALCRVVGLAFTLSAITLLQRQQAPRFDAHLRAGGRRAPWWPVTLITLGAALAFFAVAVVIVAVVGPA
jgi:hypothetical protein